MAQLLNRHVSVSFIGLRAEEESRRIQEHNVVSEETEVFRIALEAVDKDYEMGPIEIASRQTGDRPVLFNRLHSLILLHFFDVDFFEYNGMIDGCGEEASFLDGERCEVLIVVVGSHSFRLSLVLFSSESVNGVF